MKRAAFLSATGLSVGRYNVHRQRDQLPIYSEPAGETNDAVNKHRAFTLEEAILTRLFVMACDHHGLAPDDATKFAWHAWMDIGAIKGQPDYRDDPYKLASSNIWAGWAITRMKHDTEMPIRMRWTAGSPEDVASHLATSYREAVDDAEIPIRITLLNVSDSTHFVLKRLEEVGELPKVEAK